MITEMVLNKETYCWDRLCFEYSDPNNYSVWIMDDFGNAVCVNWAIYNNPLYPYGYYQIFWDGAF